MSAIGRFFGWRWTPFLGLTLASATFGFVALLLAPRSTPGEKIERGRQIVSASALRFDDIRSEPTARDAREDRPRASAQPDKAATAPEIRSFFPPPSMVLPPPLFDDEPSPEPQGKIEIEAGTF